MFSQQQLTQLLTQTLGMQPLLQHYSQLSQLVDSDSKFPIAAEQDILRHQSKSLPHILHQATGARCEVQVLSLTDVLTTLATAIRNNSLKLL